MKRDRLKSGILSVKYAVKMAMASILLSVFLFSGVVYAEEDYKVTEMNMQGTIKTDSSLNVRSGPGKEYESIDKVSNDVVLKITGLADNGWYQVEIGGRTGYVSGQYVDTVEIVQEEAAEPGEEEVIGEPEEGYRGLNQSPFVMKTAAIGGIIVVVLVMLFLTVKGIRKGGDDQDDDYEDDGDYEADDYEDDGDYEADDYDDDGDYEADDYEDDDDGDGGDYEAEDFEDSGDYEADDYDDGDDYEDEAGGDGRLEDGYHGNYGEGTAGRRKGHKSGDSQKVGKKTERKAYILREEDYRVDIDPSFFEDREPIEQPAMVTGYLERKKIEEEAAKARAKEASEGKQKELDEAMEKLSELQREIERLKKQE